NYRPQAGRIHLRLEAPDTNSNERERACGNVCLMLLNRSEARQRLRDRCLSSEHRRWSLKGSPAARFKVLGESPVPLLGRAFQESLMHPTLGLNAETLGSVAEAQPASG